MQPFTRQLSPSPLGVVVPVKGAVMPPQSTHLPSLQLEAPEPLQSSQETYGERCGRLVLEF